MNFDLREYRKSKNMKQVPFAKKIGVSNNFISIVETGLKPVSSHLIQRICDSFGEEMTVVFKPKFYQSKIKSRGK